MKRKLELNQCKKCQRTYDINVVNATSDICSHCNENQSSKVREKDALRKSLSINENDKPCDNLEKLGDICE